MRRLIGAVSLAFAAASASSQLIPTASLGGLVTTEDGTPIPSAAVRVESAALQGSREATTSPGGRYLMAALPPGEYRVSFAAKGMQGASRTVTLSAATTVRLDQVLVPAAVSESVTVSSQAAVVRGPEAGTYIPQDLLNKLPSGRALRDAALLAPGVNDNGPSTGLGSANQRPAIMISGAVSYENLFLVNGAVVNDNVREQPQDLFIEDAIQETTVQTGRISAEYGRFMGGVVNVVTRSGGNILSGTFRATLSSDQWTANNAYDKALGVDNRAQFMNEAYEATLGLPLWKDRLWVFAAGRFANTGQSFSTRPQQKSGTPVPYVYGRDEWRFEAKVTTSPAPWANLVVSYIQNHLDETNYAFNRNILETETLMPRTLPSSVLAVNGSGLVGRSVFLEAQYSKRRFQIVQTGPNPQDRIQGTTIFDNTAGVAFGAPVGSGQPPNDYDNQSWSLKGSYPLSTRSLGEHDLRAGYEGFREVSQQQNNSSSSGYRINATEIVRGTEVFPVFDPKSPNMYIQWNPVVVPAAPSSLLTQSVFLNDRVSLGRHWSLNLGLRWDKNHDTDSNGTLVSNSGAFSPRLGVRFDPRGDGRLVFDAGHAKYVTRIYGGIANGASPAGNVATYQWAYHGPCINCDPFAPTSALVPKDQALAQLFAWFDLFGGTANPGTIGLTIPGYSTRIAPGGLRSPYVLEASAGAEAALGTKGSIRADLFYRNYRDLYSGRVDLTTGQTPEDATGKSYDIEVVGNSNQIKRRYTAVQLQALYQFTPALSAAATYTWSNLTGNFLGEFQCCPASWSFNEEYPEYKQSRWNAPMGPITGREVSPFWPDQRNRARIWVVYQVPVRLGTISVSALEAFDSGRGYQAVGLINPTPYVTNPGYANPLGTAVTGGAFPAGVVAYYFTKPGAYLTGDVWRTDLALDWAVPVYRQAELFLHAQVFNLADQQAIINVNTTVLTNHDLPAIAPFNPFMETPKPGVNYVLGQNFGKPTSSASYQQPRTFVLAVGARF